LRNGIHVLSGLPRSGCILPAARLRFAAGMTSPIGSLFKVLLGITSARDEAAVFIDDDKRQRLLRAVFDACYADIHPARLVFGTNRQWTTKLPALVGLFPAAKIICSVRIRPGSSEASKT
jgi:sulfotransferase